MKIKWMTMKQLLAKIERLKYDAMCDAHLVHALHNEAFGRAIKLKGIVYADMKQIHQIIQIIDPRVASLIDDRVDHALEAIYAHVHDAMKYQD